MKVVILAGGYGTRLSEETQMRPKPMVEVGGRPILWHIMKHYGHHGLREFIIALGYKSEVIKQYFVDYYMLNGNLSVDLGSGDVRMRKQRTEDWVVHLVETGLDTNTGGRLEVLESEIGNETFMLSYGDGVCNVDLQDLLRFHREQGVIATVTAVRPPARFGGMVVDGPRVTRFTEKPQIGEGWINGGFMVFEPGIFSYLQGPGTSLEAVALEKLAEDGQLAAFQHDQFWQCMDTQRELRVLESLWQSGKPEWKTWED